MKAYQWVNKLDAIVFWRVVTGRDHAANCLSVQLPRSQSSEKSDPEHNRIEQISLRSFLAGFWTGIRLHHTYAFIRN